jgi:hypothetical protein
MASTPLKAGRGEGGFKEGKSRQACYGLDLASSRCGAGRRGDQRWPDSVAVWLGLGDDRWGPPIN